MGEISNRSRGYRQDRRKSFGGRIAARYAALAFGAVALVPAAPGASAQVALSWIPGSSVKVEQVIGDKDWADAAKGIDTPTASRTITRFDVEGLDLGSSFEQAGKLVVLFGDTIGARTLYRAHDTMAWSTSTDPGAGLLLNFYTNADGSTLLVEPPGVSMGADDTPNAGISLADGIYIVCNTGADTSQANPHEHDYSVLVRFDDATKEFTAGRTISTLPGGRFIITALHLSGSEVFMFGVGDYRASDVYLARTPASSFASGAGTEYFAGLVAGQPTWTATETGAVPVVVDDPLGGPAWPNDTPTIGNVSVIYSSELRLWLMAYDGGRQKPATAGVYVCYAPEPWGPWSAPQLVFNATRDHGLGEFIHDPSLPPPGDGLTGPTIGGNDPATTRGGDYAPELIERFTRVQGDMLSISYLMSTWNPYTVVRMRSDLSISVARDEPRRRLHAAAR